MSEQRRVPEEEAATLDEVAAAIDRLGDVDWIKLRKYAAWRVRGVPPSHREGRDAVDLLGAAIERTLEGRRRWRRSTVLSGHLIDTMCSIANHWAEDPAPDSAILASDLTVVAEDRTETNPLMAAPDTRTSPEGAAMAKDLVERIEAHFASDPLARDVLAGMMMGMSRAELAADLKVDELRVDAVVKRIRRHARSYFPEGKDL